MLIAIHFEKQQNSLTVLASVAYYSGSYLCVLNVDVNVHLSLRTYFLRLTSKQETNVTTHGHRDTFIDHVWGNAKQNMCSQTK